MITRIWHGWTAPGDAESFQILLLEHILPAIAGRDIAGYRGASVGRRDSEGEVEFVVTTWFDSLDAVRAFAGEEYTRAVVPMRAQALLARFDEHAAHYETLLAPPAADG